jgi:hypothetical protein
MRRGQVVLQRTGADLLANLESIERSYLHVDIEPSTTSH